jgi:hypothetical protein
MCDYPKAHYRPRFRFLSPCPLCLRGSSYLFFLDRLNNPRRFIGRLFSFADSIQNCAANFLRF